MQRTYSFLVQIYASAISLRISCCVDKQLKFDNCQISKQRIINKWTEKNTRKRLAIELSKQLDFAFFAILCWTMLLLIVRDRIQAWLWQMSKWTSPCELHCGILGFWLFAYQNSSGIRLLRLQECSIRPTGGRKKRKMMLLFPIFQSTIPQNVLEIEFKCSWLFRLNFKITVSCRFCGVLCPFFSSICDWKPLLS